MLILPDLGDGNVCFSVHRVIQLHISAKIHTEKNNAQSVNIYVSAKGLKRGLKKSNLKLTDSRIARTR